MGREEVGISKGLSGSSLRYRRYTGADNILPYSCEEHDRMKCCGCATRREHGLKEIIDSGRRRNFARGRACLYKGKSAFVFMNESLFK